MSSSTAVEKQQQQKPFSLYYWPIRDRASACRAAFIFNNVPFKDERVQDWDEKSGTQAKIVKEHNIPMANLPTLVLPDGSALTQTGTVLKYIGTLGETKPRNDLDAARISMVVDHLLEMNEEKYKTAYGDDALKNVPSFFANSIPYYFGTLEKWMTNRGTEFVATTDYLSVADICLAEFLESFKKMSEVTGAGSDWLKSYPNLVAVYKKVVEHPRLKAYFEAEKSVPHNAPDFAKWF